MVPFVVNRGDERPLLHQMDEHFYDERVAECAARIVEGLFNDNKEIASMGVEFLSHPSDGSFLTVTERPSGRILTRTQVGRPEVLICD